LSILSKAFICWKTKQACTILYLFFAKTSWICKAVGIIDCSTVISCKKVDSSSLIKWAQCSRFKVTNWSVILITIETIIWIAVTHLRWIIWSWNSQKVAIYWAIICIISYSSTILRAWIRCNVKSWISWSIWSYIKIWNVLTAIICTVYW